MSSEIVVTALGLAGIFTLGLGIVHIAIPLVMDFDHAIPTAAVAPTPLHSIGFGGRRYQVLRSDVRGIAWVMSNAAAYVLITLGVADLVGRMWVATDVGRLIALWAVGWWAIRAGGQLVVGRRAGDVAFAVWFGSLAAIHLVAVFA